MTHPKRSRELDFLRCVAVLLVRSRWMWMLGLACCVTSCRDGGEPAGELSSARPAEWFQESTERLGLNFIHDAGATGRFEVPQQMGSGAALFDYDNDGWLDIYLIHNGGPRSRSTNRLWHQEPGGRFKDVSAGSGLDVAGTGMGAAAGDLNNDGWTDLVLTEYGAAHLFVNQRDGTFRDLTREAGLDNPRWATSAALFDYDRDGWLDLVVANYLDYNPTQKCTDANGAPEFCGPHGFPGLAAKLFRNLGRTDSSTPPAGPAGGVRFEDVTLRSGLARWPGPALGVVCADFDGDRWPDIFLADDGRPNRLFINRRDGTFAEEAAVRGVAYNAMGQTAGDMGIALGDVDEDRLFDLFVTHLSEENHALWKQGPRGLFQDRTALSGLNAQSWRGTGFGTAFLDVDHDGDLDLALVNGRVKRGNDSGPVARGVAPFWAPYAQRPQLFVNEGQGQFRDVSPDHPAFCDQAVVGRGLACGDVDNDGDMDLLVTSTGGPARIYSNVASKRGHWLMVRAIDPALGGRDAHGAEITVQAGPRRWWRLAQPAYSYLCSNDPRAHFGLGDATTLDSIRVLWPDGAEEEFPGGPVDRLLALRKGSGKSLGP